MLQLELLSTQHCSLCDQALDLLFAMPELAGLRLSVVDISLDEQLIARYGAQIPVLCVAGAPEETVLVAPFERGSVLDWLSRMTR